MPEVICISYETELQGSQVIIKVMDKVKAADNPYGTLRLTLFGIIFGRISISNLTYFRIMFIL